MRDDAPRARINDYDNASSDELIFQGLSPAEITTTHHKTDENTNTPSLEAEVVTTETEEHEPLSNDPFEEDATMANPDPPPSTLEEVEPRYRMKTILKQWMPYLVFPHGIAVLLLC